MNPRLLHLYNQELRHLREMGSEFAEEFPKIASRLSMDGLEVADPYVERLLEGAAFLAARVQLKLEAEFPRFTHHLLEMVHPHFLSPTPAMAIAQFQPILSDANLAEGFVIKRGSALHTASAARDGSACTFTTAQDVRLWPIEVVDARYFSAATDLPLASPDVARKFRGGVRIRLRCTAGLRFDQLGVDRLRFCLGGADEAAYRLLECIGSNPLGVMITGVDRPIRNRQFLAGRCLTLAGYDEDEALLPSTPRGFSGHRLIHEYFAFPQRFLFFDISGLAAALPRLPESELELHLLFSKGDVSLESQVDAGHFLLNATPVINLFKRRADRIHVTTGEYEFHVVPDRTRAMDFEVYDVQTLTGYSSGVEREQNFVSFYESHHGWDAGAQGYFTLRREPRLLSERQRRIGTRTRYTGSETFVSIVDSTEAPYSPDLRQLAATLLCTNRDLPILLNLSGQGSDFALDVSAPVEGVRCVRGPSMPAAPVAEGARAWKCISLLSLNYLSLLDSDSAKGAAALREMLGLYGGSNDLSVRRQIEGLRSVHARAFSTRLPMAGPPCFGRGIDITVEVDELAFEGGSAFLLGSVLEHFFARYVSINSFTRTRLRSLTRGEVMNWEVRCGLRPTF